MGTRRDAEINQLLNEAEAQRSCLAACDRTLKEALDRRVGTRLVRPRPRLFARTTYWEALDRIERERHVVRGLAMLHPGWTFSHASAALMHGLPVSLRHLRQAHILAPEAHVGSSLVIRHRPSRTHGTVEVSGARVTSLEDTIVDCLLALDFREGLAIADAAVARLGIDAAGLMRLARQQGHRRPGVRQALQTAQWADGRSESGGESIARAIMIEHGFMVPELQVVVGDPARMGASWRCDYFWLLADGTRVAGELDGLEKYANPQMTHGRSTLQVMQDERLRESQLTLAVDRVLRFSWADVRDERRLVAKLEQFGIPRVR